MSRVIDTLNEYRARALNREAATRRDLVRRWLRVEDALADKIEALIREVADLRGAGKPFQMQVYSLERYQSLLGQAQAEMRNYARYAEDLISHEQYLAAVDGLDYGVDSIKAVLSDAGISASFTRLDVEAVNIMAGFAADGSPLSQLLMRAYPETAVRLTDTLVTSVALGRNPRTTARLMREDMAGNLQHALVVARSEQLRVLRVANVRQYQASGVVQTYRRRAARNEACLACLLEDGTEYPVGVQFGDHPKGRCYAEPALENFPSPYAQSGQEYFEGLDPAAQREIMGDARYEAWRSGDVPLEAMARMHTDPTWGESPQIVPLNQLTGQASGLAMAAG